ncbi:MAG TPA: PspC domain-containing protein [Bacteroidia bacterium]|nr:PspC domain-containing protein [Bacteroidia bacterium]
MNKTYTINISGIIFHIDEFAYEKLKGYLNTIRSYFKDSEGRDEIMTDIESRIAEIFSARINNAKEVILMDDVDHMIAIMGNPEVFKNEDGTEADSKYNTYSYENKTADFSKRKRIFRDPDDKVLGGVCSGVGNYFDIDPLWIRLAFAASFFYFGTGFLFYIILWMVIPEARTTAEKLEMRGEKVNINNIEKNFKEEMEGLKNRFNDSVSGNESSSNTSKIRSFINRTVDLFIQLLGGFGRVFLKIIGFILVFFGVMILVALLASIFGNGGFINISDRGINSIAIHDLLLKFFNTTEQITEAKAAIFLLIGIPVIMFIYQGVKILFKIKVRNKWVNITSTLLWLIGLGLTIDVLSNMSLEFKHKNSIKEKFVIATPKSNTLYLNLPENYKWSQDDDEEYFDEDVKSMHNRWNVMINNEKGLDFYMPIIDIQRSKTDSFELLVMKSSKGKSKKDALRRAESISYSYMVNDSNVIFNPKFQVPETEKWRAQRVKIILKVPTGKSVYLNNKIAPLIYDIDNVTNTFDGDMVNHKWTMRAEGLTCDDCGDINGFKKKKNEKDSTDVEESENDY